MKGAKSMLVVPVFLDIDMKGRGMFGGGVAMALQGWGWSDA